MKHSLFLTVHLHDDRWHGVGDWPPSPMRLFQALVAGVGLHGALADHREALAWLEAADAPTIAAPLSTETRGFTNFVPNNDLDAVGGDPRRVGEIRAGKTIKPRLFQTAAGFLYAWTYGGDGDADRHARAIIAAAECLYQFGRGVDMAWATGEIVTADEAEARLAAHPGQLWRPSKGAALGGTALRCPQAGTLESLIERHREQSRRISGGLLRQPRQAVYRQVGYDCPPDRLLFDLKPRDGMARFKPWPLTEAAALATSVRNKAVARLTHAMPGDKANIEPVLVGRGATERDKAARVRILPLPSIGGAHTDPSIRRVLVERPPDCPLSAGDLAWAFSGLDLGVDYATGEVAPNDLPVLAPAADAGMLHHYGMDGEPSERIWRTVTPAALPVHRAAGRRPGSERADNEAAAAQAARQALRHAGITAAVEMVRVQREPFAGRGALAAAFAAGTRFPASQLWHLEIGFRTPVAGPLVIGDGRYCGLGLMYPPTDVSSDILVLPITATHRPGVAHRAVVVAALRRALMSRSADADGRVPTLFSGHANGPGPARSGDHRHVYLLADDEDGDGLLDRLVVIAPWRVDHSWTPGRSDRQRFEQAVRGLDILRAGTAGVLLVGPAADPRPDDDLFRRAQTWVSHTSYWPTRHPRNAADVAETIARDLTQECERRGLPRPDVEVMRTRNGPHGGIRAEMRLQFRIVARGPILLGRDAHRGGGLFAAR